MFRKLIEKHEIKSRHAAAFTRVMSAGRNTKTRHDLELKVHRVPTLGDAACKTKDWVCTRIHHTTVTADNSKQESFQNVMPSIYVT